MEQKLYTIGEVSRLTGASIKTIRYYDEIALLQPASKTEAGYRLYTLNQAYKLQLILTFKLMGFNLNEIQQILSGDVSIENACRLQLKTLIYQVEHLNRMRSIMEEVIASNQFQSPTFLSQIREELQMSQEYRQEAILDELKSIICKNASQEWADHFINSQREMLINLETKDQLNAFNEFKELLLNPEFIAEIQTSMAPFWSMVEENDISTTDWEQDMSSLYEPAIKAAENHEEPSGEIAQELVDQWITILSKNLNKPVNQAFMEKFKQMARTMDTEYSRKYWEIACRLKPSLRIKYKAHRLLLDGLAYRDERE